MTEGQEMKEGNKADYSWVGFSPALWRCKEALSTFGFSVPHLAAEQRWQQSDILWHAIKSITKAIVGAERVHPTIALMCEECDYAFD